MQGNCCFTAICYSGFNYTASYANNNSKGVIAAIKTPDGTKLYSVAKEGKFGGDSGEYAVRDEKSGKYYKADKDGNGILSNGKPQTVKENQLRGGVMSAKERVWNGVKKTSDTLFESMGAERLDKTTNGTNNNSSHKGSNNTNNSVENIDTHNTPPKENLTGTNPSSSNDYNTKAKGNQGVKRGLKAGGAAGVVASLADAYATGNMDNIVKNVKEWGGKIADGNLVGKDGALSDVEAIFTGRSSTIKVCMDS